MLWLRRSLIDIRNHSAILVIEIVSIFLSVLLAFSLGQWQQQHRDHRIAQTALDAILREVELNRTNLLEKTEEQLELVDRLANAPDSVMTGRSAMGVLFEVAGDLEGRPPVVRRAAWDAAVQSGALNHLDYAITERLSAHYSTQRLGFEAGMALTQQFIWNAASFDKSRTAEQVEGFSTIIAVLVDSETNLAHECEALLADIEALRDA